MKKRFRKASAGLLTMAMLLGMMAGCGNNTGDTPSGSPSSSEQAQSGDLGSGEVKWSEEKTADGWIKVTNTGGATLGYSPDSGVKLIQVDGFAFKDLNGNGVLDVYEDWRQNYSVRAEDLAAQMPAEEIIPLTTHGGWKNFGNDISENDLAYIRMGGRDGVTRSSSYEGSTATAVKWTNAVQAASETEGSFGIPSTISVDPHNISNTIDQLGLAATMNTELAHEIGVETAKQYRAVGITMLLGPQIDMITTPLMNRGNGAYTEDPALDRDLAAAFIDGMQSTFDENGNDLGWGEHSVISIAKHFAGAGATEGGRNDHDFDGRFTVFPGDSFRTHLIPFFDGAFNLPGKTEAAGGVMTNYAISYSEDGSLGELVGGAYSEYKLNLLAESGYDGFILTDWGIVEEIDGWGATWGVQEMTTPERFAWLYKLGVDQIGGTLSIEEAMQGYNLLAADMGDEAALEQIRSAAYQVIMNKMVVGLFENPYLTTEHAIASIWTPETKAFGDETQSQAVIMLKNSNNIIGGYKASEEKPTAYIPYTIRVDGDSWNGFTYTCEPSINLEAASRYYNVVTDTVGEPTGTDERGETIYTADDIIRASAEEIAACDIAIVKMTQPYTMSAYDAEKDLWLPPSIQYEEYTANSASVRRESIGGGMEFKEIPTIYGTTTQEVKENQSYYGNTAAKPLTYGSYETLKFVSDAVSDDCKVIIAMEMTHGAMVWSEVEPLADAILMKYKNGGFHVGDSELQRDVILEIIVGEVEPSALLPLQQPASMEAVEAQLEDVPRDTQCYVDANGNTYDFAFGLNWSGVIKDARTAEYSVPALTSPANMSN